MGFIQSATTIEVIAKLTTKGRVKLLNNNQGNVITHFSLGDSDANYYTSNILDSGNVPLPGGDYTINMSCNCSFNLPDNTQIRSYLLRNGNIETKYKKKKLVQSSSQEVIVEKVMSDLITISGTNLEAILINRNNDDDKYVNLFKTFNLPITYNDKLLFTQVEYPYGFKNTAIEELNQDTILVISIPNQYYGEIIDGKSIKYQLSRIEIYSTYQNVLKSPEYYDNQIIETSSDLIIKNNDNLNGTNIFGNNVVFLFSDYVNFPNNDMSKSWGTGYNQFKCYSKKSKELFNLIDKPNLNISADTCVGIAYLDLGFIVITHPDIISMYNETTFSGSTLSFKTQNTIISKKISCLVERGEFVQTTNPTYNKESGDILRISEIALWDDSGDLIAYGKLDRQIELTPDMFLAFGVKIIV